MKGSDTSRSHSGQNVPASTDPNDASEYGWTAASSTSCGGITVVSTPPGSAPSVARPAPHCERHANGICCAVGSVAGGALLRHPRAGTLDPSGQLARGHRSGEVVALRHVAAERGERIARALGLDSLGDRDEVEVVGE